MKYRTVFDIIGPIMIGPSSSHTAGVGPFGRGWLEHYLERNLMKLLFIFMVRSPKPIKGTVQMLL